MAEEVVTFDTDSDHFHCGYCGQEVELMSDGDYYVSYGGVCYDCKAFVSAVPVKFQVCTESADPDSEDYNEFFGDC